MRQGMGWYKRYPHDFLDGIQGLGPELIGAYSVILDLIYARDGDTPRDDRHLAGLMGCSLRKARALTDHLLELGKLSVRDGFITNSRAETELKLTRNRREASAKGGRSKPEKRADTSKNNNLATSEPQASRVEKSREDKSRKETSKEKTVATLPAPQKKAPPKRHNKTTIPDGFPSEENIQWAVTEKHLSRLVAESQAQQFRNSAMANDRRYASWDRAWQNWIIGGLEKGWINNGKQSFNGNGHAKPSQSDIDNAAFSKAMAELQRERGQ